MMVVHLPTVRPALLLPSFPLSQVCAGLCMIASERPRRKVTVTILVRERFPRKAGGRIIPPEWTSISTFCGMPHAMHMHIFTSAGKRHETAKFQF